MTVEHSLTVPGITPDPAEDHLVAYGAVQNIVREGIGDVGLKLYSGASRKGIPPFPVHEGRGVSPQVE